VTHGSLPGFKVGIVWEGNPRFHWDRHRSFPLGCLAPLAEVEGETARQGGVVLPRSIVARLPFSDLYCTHAPNTLEVRRDDGRR
jgi:hypothetical protein